MKYDNIQTHTQSRLGRDDEVTMNLPSNIYIALGITRQRLQRSAGY